MFRTIMFGAMACIVTACVLAGAAEAQPMSPATFRDEIARRISQAWKGLCFEKPDEYTLRVGRSQDNCAEIILSTANVYRKYENDKEHSPVFADNLVDVALRGLESLERGAVTPSREKLVAVVRPKEFVAAYESPEDGVWEPFIGDLIKILGEKDGDQIRYLLSSDLEKMELAEPAAWKIAQENLPQYIGDLERYEEGGAVQFSAESGLAPSFMLLADTCVASGPSFDIHLGERDSFLYVDRRNSEATSMLASYVADLVRTGDAYSETLISCDGGEWYALIFDGVDTWAPEQRHIRAN